MNAEMSGVMFESRPAHPYELFGFVRVGGVEYKLMAYPHHGENDRRWSLKLVPA
jgi:hypothetical protein